MSRKYRQNPLNPRASLLEMIDASRTVRSESGVWSVRRESMKMRCQTAGEDGNGGFRISHLTSYRNHPFAPESSPVTSIQTQIEPTNFEISPPNGGYHIIPASPRASHRGQREDLESTASTTILGHPSVPPPIVWHR